jgi:hypothetical protein
MSSTRWTRGLRRLAPAAWLVFALSGCSDGGSDRPVTAPEAIVIAGSVGDGPVVDAALSFVDAAGTLIGQANSDDQARYEFVVPAATLLPVKVVASGGRDLVSGRPLDFDLVGVLGPDQASSASTLNLSPQSTLTVNAVECSGKRLSYRSLTAMWSGLRGRIGMGLSAQVLPDPMFDPIDRDNVADIVLASEALAEVLRRTARALDDVNDVATMNELVRSLACDLGADAEVDGQGAGAKLRAAAVFRAASAEVLLEQAAGQLEVDDQPATGRMDAAISQIMPEAAGETVLSVGVTPELQAQVLRDLLLLQSRDESDTILDLIDIVQASEPEQLGNRVRVRLDARAQQALSQVTQMLASSASNALQAVGGVMAEQADGAAPFISFFASRPRVDAGDSVNLSWAVAAADRCRATGDWTGRKSLEGTRALDGLKRTGEYVLTCFSSGGSNRAVVQVQVDGRVSPKPPAAETAGPVKPPARTMPPGADLPDLSRPIAGPPPASRPGVGQPAPSQPPAAVKAPPVRVDLQVSDTAITAGESVTLRWSSENADQCRAFGSWTGAKPLSGAVTLRNVRKSGNYSLLCRTGGVSENALVRVEVAEQGTLRLAWTAPESNVDGTPVEALRGYRLHYGLRPGSYDQEVTIDDGAATEVSLEVPRDTYYLALSAIDRDGAESELSNEIRKTVR